jgi:hypothetical protein
LSNNTIHLLLSFICKMGIIDDFGVPDACLPPLTAL